MILRLGSLPVRPAEEGFPLMFSLLFPVIPAPRAAQGGIFAPSPRRAGTRANFERCTIDARSRASELPPKALNRPLSEQQ